MCAVPGCGASKQLDAPLRDGETMNSGKVRDRSGSMPFERQEIAGGSAVPSTTLVTLDENRSVSLAGIGRHLMYFGHEEPDGTVVLTPIVHREAPDVEPA
jgi:hypothetical protein